MTITLTEDAIARFWSKIDKTSSPNGCWIWNGHKDNDGYGIITVSKQNKKAHRISYQIHKGDPGDKLERFIEVG